MKVVQGLIIAEPWIDYILTGSKIWEMRSKATSKRGWIGLITKGSGRVTAVAELVGVEGPLSEDEMLATERMHRIPAAMVSSGEVAKWRYAWKFAKVIRLEHPVSYRHPFGAVRWVNLDPDVVAEIERQIATGLVNDSDVANCDPPPISPSVSIIDPPSRPVESKPVISGYEGMVPIASDGSEFLPQLLRAGFYTVGTKGAEQKFGDFEEALAYLRAMPTARWRRPNAQGNWGIVSAVDWRPRG